MKLEKGKYYTIRIKTPNGWTKLLEGCVCLGSWSFSHSNYSGTKTTIFMSTPEDTKIYHQGTLERKH